MTRFLRLLWLTCTPCQHVDADGHSLMRRERRGEAQTLFLVCPRCDRAVPALSRTPAELAQPRLAPSHERLKAQKVPAPVVKFELKKN